MPIDRSNFLVVAGALAAGGVGGWALRNQATEKPPTPAPEAVKPKATLPEVPTPVTVLEPTSGAASCDDSVGVPGECPSVGPSDEGVCPNVIFKRCSDYKTAFKPRVAQAAVSCLQNLKANERCDPNRINQCGHAALMSACPEPTPPPKATLQPASATAPLSVSLSPDTSAPASQLDKSCESVMKACAGQPLAPSLAECRLTLAGMTESGRASTVECAASHCADRGLLGCEAVPRPTAALVR